MMWPLLDSTCIGRPVAWPTRPPRPEVAQVPRFVGPVHTQEAFPMASRVEWGSGGWGRSGGAAFGVARRAHRAFGSGPGVAGGRQAPLHGDRLSRSRAASVGRQRLRYHSDRLSSCPTRSDEGLTGTAHASKTQREPRHVKSRIRPGVPLAVQPSTVVVNAPTSSGELATEGVSPSTVSIRKSGACVQHTGAAAAPRSWAISLPPEPGGPRLGRVSGTLCDDARATHQSHI